MSYFSRTVLGSLGVSRGEGRLVCGFAERTQQMEGGARAVTINVPWNLSWVWKEASNGGGGGE